MVRAFLRGALVGARDALGFAALVESLENVRNAMHDMRRDLNYERSRQPPPAPDPLVCMLIFAHVIDEFGSREPYPAMPRAFMAPAPVSAGELHETAMGVTGRATDKGSILEFVPQRPMVSVRVVLLYDLERVNVSGIFYGSNLLAAGVGDSLPFAYLKRAEVGMRIRAHVSKRKES